jgi:hypothetical protein
MFYMDFMLELPSDGPLSGTEGPNVPYFFVGDEGLALTEIYFHLLVDLTRLLKKRVLNYRLFRARRYVECVFGILSNKWRIFQRPLNVSPDFTVDIVKACVVMRISFRERGVCKLRTL